MTSKLPARSYALIQELHRDTPRPSLPDGPRGWAALDDKRVRELAYAAGRRSLVNDLIERMQEELGEYLSEADPRAEPEGTSAEDSSLLSYRVLAEPRVVNNRVEAPLDIRDTLSPAERASLARGG